MNQPQTPNPQTAVALLLATSPVAKTKAKGGRPFKAASEKQSHTIAVRLTDEEYATITAEAARAGLSLGEVARRGALNHRTTIINPQVAVNLRELNRLGNLLNQALTSVHTCNRDKVEQSRKNVATICNMILAEMAAKSGEGKR
jgi:uncharacterized protein (DUF1778 family)